jgi:putative ABC transport system permease protein
MLRNYFKIGFRNILKHKFYSAINIIGLTVGITASLFISLYLLDELGYDQFHTKIDQMYRVGLHGKLGGQDIMVTSTCPPLAHTMVDEVPEVEDATRIMTRNNIVIKYEDMMFTEDDIFFADSNFFSFFSFELLQGDPNTALIEPNSMIMTETVAEKYFGKNEALGKLVTVGTDQTYKITGIVADPPSNSHLKFRFIFSFSSNDASRSEVWLNNFLHTYFTLREGSDLNNVQSKLDEMVVRYVGPEIQQYMGISIEEFLAQDGAFGYLIDPVKEIHLQSRLQGEIEPTGDIAYIYIFAAIGLFIILIAAINFMNLSTARSAGRAREVGLRKTFGSFRSQLIYQFLVESLIYSMLAALLAIIFTVILLPQFNLISGKVLFITSLYSPTMIIGFVLIITMVGLLAGSYPAFYLTHFKVTEVLKGKVAKGMKAGKVRGALVVLQFAISIFLIICTAIVYQQIQFTQNKNLGFDKEKILVIYNTFQLDNNRKAFKNALLDQHDISNASYSNNVIPGVNNTTIFRKDGADDDHILGQYYADYEHVETMGYVMEQGRSFSRDFPSDSLAVMVNQATVDEMGWENPLEEYLISFNTGTPERLKVIGVIQDFNFMSLKDAISPLTIRLLEQSNLMTVRLNTTDFTAAVKLIEDKWKEFAPGQPFEFAFLDQNFDELYRSETRLSSLFTIFTAIAIAIAALGLFGLAAFTAEQRTKEIGIRKAMGASNLIIILLLSKEFAKYVVIAFILSIAPSYFFINDWLEGFVYRVDISVGIFILSGLMALVIALLTVSYQSIKASSVSPTESLRYE